MQFLDQYLEEMSTKQPRGNDDNLQHILEKLIESTTKKENQHNLKHVSEKFIIEKFTSKNPNAVQWIENFEKECERFNITKDETKIDILRLFLENSSLDWYSSMVIKLSVNSEWNEWKDKFLETFRNQGWDVVTTAFTFKYKEGLLIDYAIKKERLILDINKSIDSRTMIDLIATGLPGFILNKLNRDELNNTTDLFNEIRKYEGMIFKKNSTITKNIINICKTCEICIKNKSRGQGKFGLMSQLGPATKPFEIMSMDTIGGFGGSRSTKKYLHLLVDHYTRYAFIVTSKTQNASDFIKLTKNVLETDEIGIILTDQYPGINSREFKQYLNENNVKLIFTAVNTPFSNGLNERLNQTIVNKIRCRINEKNNKRTWTTVARECIEKYNETEHSVTGFAPKYLLDGTNVSILPNELKIIEGEDKWIADKRLALENTIKSHKYNKKIFDRKRKMQEFNIGDSVYVENGNRLNRKKLDELKIGPFKIVGKISNSIYRIDTGNRKTESTLFHITKLQPVTTESEEDEI
ncbi:uncharacterized protein LOC125059273 [Pieris napi]|uniref:uncharacterized protein LOC125059273 n=1 Tax=Pieris napi TaxID=78633 RepID=UPI001FB9CEBE|nr:uncharacterized protein LOC125059273 [Pieris napi]